MKALRLVATALLLALPTAVKAADLTIQNTRAAGFADPTPAPPLGLNPGTTRGDQALIVFQTAAAMWGATVRSGIPILIDSQFDSSTTNSEFDCTSEGTVLAFTQPSGYIVSGNFPIPLAAYPIPLANALTNSNNVASTSAQFQVNINADLGTSLCDFPASWYFGLDTQIPPDGISLLTTLLHEFGHGLGYSSLVDPSNGSAAANRLAIFDFHIWDVVDGVSWTGITAGQRKGLITTPSSLAFQGPAVQADIPTYLAAPPTLFSVFNAVSTDIGFAQGEFSGPLTGSGPLVAAVPLDACSDLSNNVQGKFALIERSLADAGVVCTFLSKAARAADAGAAGVIIYDSIAEDLIEMAGTPALNIPATFISNSDGTTLQTELATSNPVTVGFGTASQVSNTDPSGTRVLLYTPSQLKLGSSLIHWNSNSYPHTLMLEFANQPDIRLNMDLTPDVMSDLGWSVVSGLGVSVVKLLDPEVPAGGEFPYLIVVINRRPTAISDVQVDLTLPSGTTLISNASSPVGCATGFPCSVGAMQPGEVLLIVSTVRASVNATAPFIATATVTPSTSDANDSLMATSSQTVATGGDVQVTVTGPSTVTPGMSATIITKITNAGPGDAAAVVLNGTVTGTATNPPALTSNAGACLNPSFPCVFGTLVKGQTVSVTSTFTVPAALQGSATYTASVTSGTPDSNAANNTATFVFSQGSSSNGGGCSATEGPVTLLGLLGVVLAIVLRKRSIL